MGQQVVRPGGTLRSGLVGCLHFSVGTLRPQKGEWLLRGLGADAVRSDMAPGRECRCDRLAPRRASGIK